MQRPNHSTAVNARWLRAGGKRSSAGSEPRQPPRYVRHRDLPRLLPVFAEEIDASSVPVHARLVGLLRRALRIERRRGLSGDWSYDLARHAHLLEAYRFELDALRTHQRQRRRASTEEPD